MARFTDCGNWVELWQEDKESMLSIMRENMRADIEAGYSLASLRAQLRGMEAYDREFQSQFAALGNMDAKQAEHWCYVDMRRRGAIA